jgi:hypothetical protein
MPYDLSTVTVRVMIANRAAGGFMSLPDARALSVLNIAGSDSGGGV